MKVRILYLRFLGSYLLILGIPIIISTLLYYEAAIIIKEEAINAQLSHQKNTVLYMDNYIQQIDTFSLQLILDEDLKALQKVNTEEFDSNDIQIIRSAVKKLTTSPNIQYSNYFFGFFLDNDIVASNLRIITGLEFSYNNFFSYNDLEYNEWLSLYKNVYSKTALGASMMTINDIEYEAISYIQPIFNNKYYGTRTFLLFPIFTQEIKSIMKIEEDTDTDIFVIDNDNNILYSNSEEDITSIVHLLTDKSGVFETKIGRNKNIIVYTQSDYNSWKYVSVIPASLAYAKSTRFFILLLLYILAAILIGGFISIILARKNHIPVKNLINNNELMCSQLDIQAKVLEALYIERLLNGYDDNRQMNIDYRAIFKEFSDDMIINVVNIFVDDNDKDYIDTLELLCITILEQKEDLAFRTHILSKNEVAIIIGFATDNVTVLNDIISSFSNILLEQFDDSNKANINIGIGQYCTSIEDICESYDKARYSLRYISSEIRESRICWYDNISTNTQKFFYPIDIEAKIINNVKSGNVQDVIAITDELYQENFVVNELSHNMKKYFLYNFFCTMLKIREKNEDSKLEFMRTIDNNILQSDRIYKLLVDGLIDITKEYESKMKGEKAEIILSIKEYISENYSNCMIDSRSVADMYGISEGHMSKIFKQQVGETFSSYLENFRIQKACELLMDESLSIKEISALVGYANVYTFRRAFKRVEGVVPTLYSKSIN